MPTPFLTTGHDALSKDWSSLQTTNLLDDFFFKACLRVALTGRWPENTYAVQSGSEAWSRIYFHCFDWQVNSWCPPIQDLSSIGDPFSDKEWVSHPYTLAWGPNWAQDKRSPPRICKYLPPSKYTQVCKQKWNNNSEGESVSNGGDWQPCRASWLCK